MLLQFHQFTSKCPDWFKNDLLATKASCITSVWQQLKLLISNFSKGRFHQSIFQALKAHELWVCNEWKCKRKKRKIVIDCHAICRLCIFYHVVFWLCLPERKFRNGRTWLHERVTIDRVGFAMQLLKKHLESKCRFFVRTKS